MALQLASPGIQVREVDLTRGGVDTTINVKAGIAAPFQQGPVNEIVTITNEKELVEVFGEPSSSATDYQYESWYACSNFLSYGGQLDVVRCGGGDLNNANVADMIQNAKNTCKSLGFNEGTEKFTDCSLKLYSQHSFA